MTTMTDEGTRLRRRSARQLAVVLTLTLVAIIVAANLLSAAGPDAPVAVETAGASATAHAALPSTSSPPTAAATRTPTPKPSVIADRSPAPTATPRPSPSPSPTPPALAAWPELTVPARAPIAELIPTSGTPASVDLVSAFTLSSRVDASAAELAARISVDPAIAFTVGNAPGGDVVLKPAEPLEPGRRYRFQLRGPAGEVKDSWAFQAEQPLQVVTTLPGDKETGVPTNTGIEVTFDQDGVRNARAHFSIEPAVEGTFEQRDRTLIFAPNELQPRTVYSVRISRGVELEGSDQVLEEDVRFQFETAATEVPPSPTSPAEGYFAFDRVIYESSVARAPVLGVYRENDRKQHRVDVFRLPTAIDAEERLRQLIAAPSWAYESRQRLVETSDLARVLTFTARPESLGDSYDARDFVRFPRALDAGHYVVVVPRAGRDRQAFLQVSDVSAYATVSSTETVVWANDVGRGEPIGGASVRVSGHGRLGRTDSEGLLRAPTPDDLLQEPDEGAVVPVLTVSALDSVLFVPLRLPWEGEYYQGGYAYELGSTEASDAYWHLLYTDRTRYRPTDRINVWGFLRERDTGRAPTDVRLQLINEENAYGWGGADDATFAIQDVTIEPRGIGAFEASLDVEDLPMGTYLLRLRVDGKQVAEQWFTVERIRKPSYALALETDHRAYIDRDDVRVTASSTFFEGTPVPGVELALDVFGDTWKTTGAGGEVRFDVPATFEDPNGYGYYDWQGWRDVFLSARPERAEEAEISASRRIVVFPSSLWLDGEATLARHRISVEGSVHHVDLARLDRELKDDPWVEVDPRGEAVSGARVVAEVTEIIPVWTVRGQVYDFHEKRVVKEYSYSEREVALGTHLTRTQSDGTFVVELGVQDKTDHYYRVKVTVTDGAGRDMTVTTYAYPPYQYVGEAASVRPYLESPNVCGGEVTEFRADEAISLTMRDREGPLPEGGSNRYLFLTAQRGVRDVRVQPSPHFVDRFSASYAPDVAFASVRFTGESYVTASSTYLARLDPQERRLKVTVEADRARYRPGEAVTLDIVTRDAGGRAVAAIVALRAVDEKLFAIGAAADVTPLEDLYRLVDTGLLASYSSHQLPTPPEGYGCGCDCEGGEEPTGGGTDTEGGDDRGRSDFRDSLLFEQVQTDVDGHATVTFDLSDDLTSWRVSAAAISDELGVGVATEAVPVGTEFFVETTVAPRYLAADRPSVRARAYGTAVDRGDWVRYVVTSPTLAMEPLSVVAPVYRQADIPLPPLATGRHEVTITGTLLRDGEQRTDRVTRTFHVDQSRLTQTESRYGVVGTADVTDGGEGLTRYTFSDEGRARYVPLLESLKWGGTTRLDEALAARIAARLLHTEFGQETDDGATSVDLSGHEHLDGGLRLLPYASPDLQLTTLALLADPDAFDQTRARRWLRSLLDERSTSRERRLVALAGLAALGDPVLPQVLEWADHRRLTVRERLHLGLAAVELGDDATAWRIERALLDDFGESLGRQIRLRVGDDVEDTVAATALLALLAAGLGDPLAERAQDYVTAAWWQREPVVLQQAAFVERALALLPGAPARFAYSVGGRRQVVTLAPGEVHAFALTAAQRRSLRVEPLSGRIGVATSWEREADPTPVAADATVTLKRSISPAGTIGEDELVEVTLVATFDDLAPHDCHTVIDTVPSGLAPIRSSWDYYSTAWDGEYEEGYETPWSVQDQRVTFCAWRGPDDRSSDSWPMRYIARVVSPGTYEWEPAIVESHGDVLAATESTTIVIR